LVRWRRLAEVILLSIGRPQFPVSVLWTLSSISCHFRLISDFLCSKNRPEVILGGSGRGRPEMTSPLESLTPTLYKWSFEIFRLSLTVKKLFDIFDLAGVSHRLSKMVGFRGNFYHKITSYQNDPQKAPPWVRSLRLSYEA